MNWVMSISIEIAGKQKEEKLNASRCTLLPNYRFFWSKCIHDPLHGVSICFRNQKQYFCTVNSNYIKHF